MTDELLWSENYDRQLDDVFAIQSEVAREVAAALEATLDPAQIARLENPPTDSTEAWELYQRGHRFLERRTADDMEAALDYFQGALVFDPEFANAHAALAETLLVLENHGVRPRDEVIPQARQALERALELDPMLPDAYTALGWLLQTEFKWDEARAAFERAIELNPSHATAHRWFGLMLGGQGKYEESIEHMEAALQADPLSSMVRGNLARELTWAGRHEEAIANLEEAIEFEPDHALNYQFLAEVYWHRGDLEDAYEAARASHELAPRNPTPAVYQRILEIEMGQSPAPARELLEDLLAGDAANAVLKASLLVALGETDEAFDWLDRAVDEKDSTVISLGQTITLMPIFDDPRYEELFARMGLEPPTS
jgi:tetratricopeptide (TPR) repeat protein